jgi:hypothetical protein
MLKANEPASPTGWARIQNIDELAPIGTVIPRVRPASGAGRKGGLLLCPYRWLLHIFSRCAESIDRCLVRDDSNRLAHDVSSRLSIDRGLSISTGAGLKITIA